MIGDLFSGEADAKGIYGAERERFFAAKKRQIESGRLQVLEMDGALVVANLDGLIAYANALEREGWK